MLAAGLLDHCRQPVQGLRPEHQVHKRRTLAQGLAFLAGDTTADTDNDGGIGVFQFAPLAQLGEDFLLGLFTNGAGIEQQHIRVFGRVGQLHTVRSREHVHHLGGVVLVHLTPVGLYKNFAGH